MVRTIEALGQYKQIRNRSQQTLGELLESIMALELEGSLAVARICSSRYCFVVEPSFAGLGGWLPADCPVHSVSAQHPSYDILLPFHILDYPDQHEPTITQRDTPMVGKCQDIWTSAKVPVKRSRFLLCLPFLKILFRNTRTSCLVGVLFLQPS